MADVEYKDKVEEKPFAIHYKVPYASIVYENSMGVKFITSGDGGGVGRNPFATDHWDIKAAQNGQLNKLYRSLNAALASGRF